MTDLLHQGSTRISVPLAASLRARSTSQPDTRSVNR